LKVIEKIVAELSEITIASEALRGDYKHGDI